MAPERRLISYAAIEYDCIVMLRNGVLLIVLIALTSASCRPQIPDYGVAATLSVPRMGSFRAAEISGDYVYLLERSGDLYVFRVNPLSTGEEPKPLRVLADAGDGNALVILGSTLYCSRRGKIEVFALDDPTFPRHIGRVGPGTSDFLSHAFIRDDNRLFLVGRGAIELYDVAKSHVPIHVTTVATNRNLFGGCLAAGRLYIADVGFSESDVPGIAIFETSKLGELREIGFVPTSHVPYSIWPIGNERLLVSMDAGTRFHSVSADNITVHGRSAIFRIDPEAMPALAKEFPNSGGRASTVLHANGAHHFVCNGVVFVVETERLDPLYRFFPAGHHLDGLPYHSVADGKYAVIAGDHAAMLLRRTDRD